ncbi:MAG TPA: hypothetical protein VK030_03405 [Actinomycetales bacterium]|nr:hypothetical protein [Actinomycetales bacterium]
MPTAPHIRAHQELHGGWTARAVAGPVDEKVQGREVAATVPGTIHTDLMAAGLIPDPYLDNHEHLVAWVGSCDWEYRTQFEYQPGAADRADLVFDGLDTVATITLNGVEIGRTFNMHRSYRFSVAEHLVEGVNELVVLFSSPVKYATAQSQELGYRPKTNPPPYNAMRKMACSFGWDWGPELPAVGIWRPVRLETWSGARLASVRVDSTVDENENGILDVVAHLERAANAEALVVRASIAGLADLNVEAQVAAGSNEVSFSIKASDVERWWPRGRGEQVLYDLDVALVSENEIMIDSWSRKIGFRSVEWRQERDEHGESFELHVNGEPVFVRGMNWIPDDAFPHRISREQYERRIKQAEGMGVNLLRVWGGGIYEADDFYEVADERGMLTWQDFTLACAAYAEEEPLYSEIEAEARENIVRLAPHPSLVLWCGNNENYLGYFDWNWQIELEDKTWGAGYYEKLFPALIAELNPTRFYIPGSPFSSLPDTHPNAADSGTMHIWDVWNSVGYENYRNHVPRFAAELGWQAPPTWATLQQALSDDPLTPESPGMLAHQKATFGNSKLLWGLLPHFKRPDDMATWNWAMQLNQARAFKTAIEHLRSYSPRCAGVVMWQINDMWPVTSWAVIDGYERPKAAYYAVAQSYADRIVTIQPRDEGFAAVAVEGSGAEWSGELVLKRLRFDGTELAHATQEVSLAAFETATFEIPADIARAENEADEFIIASLGTTRGMWFFAAPRDSALRPAQIQTLVTPTDTGATVKISASNLVRDVAVLADVIHPDARVDQSLVTLLPGEHVTFRVELPQGISASRIEAPGVIRAANELV